MGLLAAAVKEAAKGAVKGAKEESGSFLSEMPWYWWVTIPALIILIIVWLKMRKKNG